MRLDHTDTIFSVAFSPNGKVIASGSKDKTVILWDAATLQPISQLITGQDAISSVAFSLDGKILASGGFDRTVILWDIETGQPIG